MGFEGGTDKKQKKRRHRAGERQKTRRRDFAKARGPSKATWKRTKHGATKEADEVPSPPPPSPPTGATTLVDTLDRRQQATWEAPHSALSDGVLTHILRWHVVGVVARCGGRGALAVEAAGAAVDLSPRRQSCVRTLATSARPVSPASARKYRSNKSV